MTRLNKETIGTGSEGPDYYLQLTRPIETEAGTWNVGDEILVNRDCGHKSVPLYDHNPMLFMFVGCLVEIHGYVEGSTIFPRLIEAKKGYALEGAREGWNMPSPFIEEGYCPVPGEFEMDESRIDEF